MDKGDYTLSASSVHSLLARLHAEAAKGHRCAEVWGSPGNPAPFHDGWAKALEYCIDEIREESDHFRRLTTKK